MIVDVSFGNLFIFIKPDIIAKIIDFISGNSTKFYFNYYLKLDFQ
jgi:hypothetical protein